MRKTPFASFFWLSKHSRHLSWKVMNKQSKFQDDIIYKSIVHELIRDHSNKKYVSCQVILFYTYPWGIGAIVKGWVEGIHTLYQWFPIILVFLQKILLANSNSNFIFFWKQYVQLPAHTEPLIISFWYEFSKIELHLSKN